ncbi:MAG: hypothetical protein HRT87_02150 [Legionellales bacterium]|nr:hypothetical protein [Legionellales bacterium]
MFNKKFTILSIVLALFCLTEITVALCVSAHLCDLGTGSKIDVDWEIIVDDQTIHTSKQFSLTDSSNHAYEDLSRRTYDLSSRTKNVKVKYFYTHKVTASINVKAKYFYTYNMLASTGMLKNVNNIFLVEGYNRLFSKLPKKNGLPSEINNLIAKYYYQYSITIELGNIKINDIFVSDRKIQLDFHINNNLDKAIQIENNQQIKYVPEETFIIERHL